MPSPASTLIEVAERFGTPTYVTDVAELRRCADQVRRAFPDPWLRQYSLKANDVPAIVGEIAACGFGANVVSRGEWALAAEARLSNDRITLEGVGKSDADLEAAVTAAQKGAPLRWVSIESVDELAALKRIAVEAGVLSAAAIDVLFRVNPGVEPETTAGLAVGHPSSKFGMTADELAEAIGALGTNGPLRLIGLHLHVGSQLAAVNAWQAAVRYALDLFAQWQPRVATLTRLDVGGGFPSGVPGAPEPADFARAFDQAINDVPRDRRPTVMAIEPGRFLTATAGSIVSRVLHVRTGRLKTGEPLVVIDAGMTELIRPALYGARHPIVALTSMGRPVAPDGLERDTAVEGPVCESTDRFGRHRLPRLQRGDLVAILETGAYASSMSSRYNGRPRPPEVLLEPDGRLRLGRPRGHAGIWQQA